MKTSLRKIMGTLNLSTYDLSTVHYLCSYYKDNANLDEQDVEYINELQSRVDKLMEEHK
jgi:hypothetical protein